MKKGRHRRFEEARALKRGPDVDIESLLDDLGPVTPSDDDRGSDEAEGWYTDEDEYLRD